MYSVFMTKQVGSIRYIAEPIRDSLFELYEFRSDGWIFDSKNIKNISKNFYKGLEYKLLKSRFLDKKK